MMIRRLCGYAPAETKRVARTGLAVTLDNAVVRTGTSALLAQDKS